MSAVMAYSLKYGFQNHYETCTLCTSAISLCRLAWG